MSGEEVAGVSVSKRSRRSRGAGRRTGGGVTFDSELIAAAKKEVTCEFFLAMDVPFGTEDGSVNCQVLRVDKYTIKVRVHPDDVTDDRAEARHRTFWLNKSAILAVGVPE